MGWANCGADTKGRRIGYAVEAVCDYPGCDQKIDRGLSYVCGEMHGECEVSCEKYFCSNHKGNYVYDDHRTTTICDSCAKRLIESGDWVEDEDDGQIVRKRGAGDE